MTVHSDMMSEIEIPDELYTLIAEEAEKNNVDIQDLIESLLEKMVANQ